MQVSLESLQISLFSTHIWLRMKRVTVNLLIGEVFQAWSPNDDDDDAHSNETQFLFHY